MLPGSLRRLAGNYAVPRARQPLAVWPALRATSRTRLAALAAPPDAVILDNVAALAQERYAEVVWVRLAAADTDPGALLLTLLGAVARRDRAAAAGIGEATARCARRGDWGQACRLLGATLGAAAARPAVLVLEGAEHLRRGLPAALDLVGPVLRPALRDDLDVLLISGAQWDHRRLAPHGQVLGPRPLRLDHDAAALTAQVLEADLPPASIRRIVNVTVGAAGAVHAALSAVAMTGGEALDAALAREDSAGLLADLARGMLARAGPATRVALAGAVRLGVWHPGLGTALGHSTVRWDEPWWFDLADGWKQLNPVWRAPLRSAGGAAALGPAALTVLADHLASQRVTDRALDLYLEAGEADRAADAAMILAGDLALWGCWPGVTRLGERLAGRASVTQPAGAGDAGAGDALAGDALAGDAGAGRAEGWPARRWWPSWMPGRSSPPDQERGRPDPESRRSGQEGRPGDPSPLTAPGAAPGRAGFVTSVAADGPAPGPGGGLARAATVHLLGELQVVIGERPVGKWVSGRGRAVFEYLVVHRHTRVRRERLMAAFWPDADADAARNRLNVAIHGLRQSLRAAAGDQPVVIYQDGCYLIDPGLDLWVDIEVFEDLVKSARQHLASDDPAAAQADFHTAIGLYQGEFLADDPYEEWAQVTTEHLRLAYLDCLDQLGRLRFDAGDYSGCADACRKLLGCDDGREDTLRRLMRCHSRLGQPQLALRQYHSFVAALRTELHLPPAPATTALAASIRRRERV